MVGPWFGDVRAYSIRLIETSTLPYAGVAYYLHAMTEKPLKLVALDTEDLAVLSAHVQDAVLKPADIAWLAREKRLALVCNRFDWAAKEASGARQRRRTGLRFDRVAKVSAKAIPKGSDSVFNLLAISFSMTDEPAGVVELAFSGGAGLRLHVECIEAALDDLGPMWATENEPRHES